MASVNPVKGYAAAYMPAKAAAPAEEAASVFSSAPKRQDTNASRLSGPASGGGFKMSSSTPDDQVAQLAMELAKAVTPMDVRMVSAKATRALADLKMSLAQCDSKDREKISKMISRMNKLIKRILKKLRQLEKEQQLQRQSERARAQNDTRGADSLLDELNRRRNKRRNEETNYALKELAGSGGPSGGAMPAGAASAAASPAPAPASPSPVTADIAAAASIDVSI